MKRLVYFSFLFSVLFFLGCNKNVGVSGKVSFDDGQPFDKGVVTFIEAKGEYSASGVIQLDGSYELLEMPANKSGIKRGDYKVVIGSTAVFALANNVPTPVQTIDLNYVDKAKTPLSVKVDKKMTYDIKVAY